MSNLTAPAQTNGYITAAITTLDKVAREYRANEVSLRRLSQSAPTRNAGATERAIERRTHDRIAAELSLAAFGGEDARALVAELISERQLLERLWDARTAGQERPELNVRLAATRRTIRRITGCI